MVTLTMRDLVIAAMAARLAVTACSGEDPGSGTPSGGTGGAGA